MSTEASTDDDGYLWARVPATKLTRIGPQMRLKVKIAVPRKYVMVYRYRSADLPKPGYRFPTAQQLRIARFCRHASIGSIA